MPGLDPGIHVFLRCRWQGKTWMAGTSPAMTMFHEYGFSNLADLV
jgi:hypothetical protein